MAPDSIFGRIVLASQVEDFVLTTLSDWWETYSREVERQLERTQGQIPLPKTYGTRNKWEAYPDDRMPMVLVVSPGTVGQTYRESDDKYNVWWGVAVGVAASARDENATRFLASFYGAVARAIMVQKGHGVWLDESFDDIPLDPQDQRTVRAAYETFQVFVEDVVTAHAGPAFPVAPDPATQPGSTWPTATTIIIDTVLHRSDEDVQS